MVVMIIYRGEGILRYRQRTGRVGLNESAPVLLYRKGSDGRERKGKHQYSKSS